MTFFWRTLRSVLCLMLLASCERLGNRFNQSQYECRIAHWSPYADKALFRLQKPDSSPVDPKSVARVTFTNVQTSQDLPLTPGGCVAVPQGVAGTLEAALPGEELGASVRVEKAERGGTVTPVPLRHIAEVQPEISCPARNVLADSSGFVLPVSVRDKESSPGLRLFLEIGRSVSSERTFLSLRENERNQVLLADEPSALPAFPDGTYTVLARAVDVLGRTPASTACVLRLDSHIPAPPLHEGLSSIRAGEAFDVSVAEGEHGFICMEPEGSGPGRCLRSESYLPFEKTVRLPGAGLWRVFTYATTEAGKRSAIRSWMTPGLAGPLSIVRNYGTEYVVHVETRDDAPEGGPLPLECKVQFPQASAANRNATCAEGPCQGQSLEVFRPCASPFRFRVQNEHLLWDNRMEVVVRATDAAGHQGEGTLSAWFLRDALERWEFVTMKGGMALERSSLFPVENPATGGVADFVVAWNPWAFARTRDLKDFVIAGDEAVALDGQLNLWLERPPPVSGIPTLVRKNLVTGEERTWPFWDSGVGRPVPMPEGGLYFEGYLGEWIGNVRTGLHRVLPDSEGAEALYLTSRGRRSWCQAGECSLDGARTYWWADADGVYSLDAEKRFQEHKILGLSGNLSEETFFVSSSREPGLEIWHRGEGKLQCLKKGEAGFTPAFEIPFPDSISVLKKDPQGEVLLGTGNGLVHSLRGEELQKWEGIPFRSPQDPNRGEALDALLKLENGEVWAHSRKGLAVFRPEAKWASFTRQAMGLLAGEGIDKVHRRALIPEEIFLVETSLGRFLRFRKGQWEPLPAVPGGREIGIESPFKKAVLLDGKGRLWAFNDAGKLFRMTLLALDLVWERRQEPPLLPWRGGSLGYDPETGVFLVNGQAEYGLEGDTPELREESPVMPARIELETSQGFWATGSTEDHSHLSLLFRPLRGGGWKMILYPEGEDDDNTSMGIYGLPNGMVYYLVDDPQGAGSWRMALTREGTWLRMTRENYSLWGIPKNIPDGVSFSRVLSASDVEMWGGTSDGDALYHGIRSAEGWQWQRIPAPQTLLEPHTLPQVGISALGFFWLQEPFFHETEARLSFLLNGAP